MQIATNDKISIGIFLEISGGNVNLLIKGKKVWNSGKNVEKCWIKDIKSMYHGFHMQKLLETICSENQSTLPVEVYVDKNEVLDGYYSSSWRKCRKEYEFQLLK